jgi:hypothetical protein
MKRSSLRNGLVLPALDKVTLCPGSGAIISLCPGSAMQMLNSHCGVDRDPRGVVRLTISNAGSLNILGTSVINAVREGLETLAKDESIRGLVPERKKHDRRRRHQGNGEARPEIGGEIHHRLA